MSFCPRFYQYTLQRATSHQRPRCALQEILRHLLEVLCTPIVVEICPKSDTPGGAGGLMNVVTPRAIIPPEISVIIV